MKNIKNFLENKAYNIRVSSILSTTEAGSGHVTSSLSSADIVAALFFYGMNHDPKNFENPNNDRFILSKGHAAPILYAIWKEFGLVTEKELLSLRKFDSILEGHPTRRFPYSEAATGSLGCGLSIGAGMAISAKIDNRSFRTYVLLGDSEMSEGSIWEAIELASFYKLNNLIGIIDCNRLGQSTQTMDGYDLKSYQKKLSAFGWETILINGHNIDEIIKALDKAKEVKNKPTMIIAKTIKGYGVSFVENKEGFHGKAFPKEELNSILKKLKEKFSDAAEYQDQEKWQPNLPKKIINKKEDCQEIRISSPDFKKDELIATRKVYGIALCKLGDVCKKIVSLDGEVKNSTYAEIFEKKHPSKFIQCFIAEQNMVLMGVGLDIRGQKPFISTFGAFFTRAYDQIRMAGIGDSKIKLVGSHAGVSIGEDGPSQMGLEDISMMRTIPNSAIFYPSDAVSTYRLVEEMANYNKGISYLRTTRAATPVIYPNNEEFPIGGCKVLKRSNQDKACLIAAGITLFEALKAHKELKAKNIYTSVIDLYSIKPLDINTIRTVARKSNNTIITIEDHYPEGGIGESICYELRNAGIRIECLAVTKMPRSGSKENLLNYEEIDSEAIISKIKEII